MKKSLSLTSSIIVSALIFLLMAGFAYGQKPKTCIDSLLTNPEYSNSKKFMNEINTMRQQGMSDRKIYNYLNAEEAKKNKAYMDAANAQFKRDFIINNNAKNKKSVSTNAYMCHADSLGLLSASSMGNWKGFTMGWANTGGCNTAPWTPVPLPCVNCIGNASGYVDNISIAPPPGSEPCADIPGFPINLPSPYGGSQSIQLGNNQIEAQSERITYSFVVQPSDISFNYQYASVLENPSHLPANQPFFDFVILDAIGDTVPCSFQHYTAAPSLPGWQTSNNSNAACDPYSLLGNPWIYYKPWSVVGVNLTGYVSQMVTVVATVADCSQCGHFGIVYLDFACTSLTAGQFCIGDTSTVLSAPYDPNFSYLWSTGATTDTIKVNPNNYLPPNDTITVHVSQSTSLCPFDFTYVLAPTIINTAFTYSINCNVVSCTDHTTITGGTLSTWAWAFPGGIPTSSNAQTPPPVTYPPGSYTISLTTTSQAGCADTTVNIPITILQPPVITANNVSICQGNSATICASGATSYSWIPSGQTSTCITVTTASAPTYTVIGTDANGCTSNTTANVTTNAVPIITASSGTVCATNNGSLCPTLNAFGGITYQWSPPTGLSSITGNSVSACPTTSITYTVVGTDASGCSNTALAPVTALPNPSVAAGPASTICLGQSTAQLSASSNPAGASYSWTPGTGLSCQSCPNPIASPGFSNTYTVYVTDQNGCIGAAVVPVTVGAIPFVSAIAPTTICTGDSATLYANVNNGLAPYSWNWNPPNALNNPFLQNPTSGAVTTTNYVITVTDANGCTDDTTTTVYLQTVPSVSWAEWTPGINCEGYIVPLMANISSNGHSTYWSFGDGTSWTSPTVTPPNSPPNPTPHSYPFGGSYSITVTVFNSPCKSMLDTTLVIPDISKVIGMLPANVFSPNGDTKNDCFHPAICDRSVANPTTACPQDSLSEQFKECIDLEVYDRWGIKMFTSSDTKKCWDGTDKSGSPAKEGTYYYIAKFKAIVLKGYVELLR